MEQTMEDQSKKLVDFGISDQSVIQILKYKSEKVVKGNQLLVNSKKGAQDIPQKQTAWGSLKPADSQEHSLVEKPVGTMIGGPEMMNGHRVTASSVPASHSDGNSGETASSVNGEQTEKMST